MESKNTITSAALLTDIGVVPLAEVAKVFGVRLRTVERWCDEPDGLPTIKVGRHRLCRLASVQQWILDREASANPIRSHRRGRAA